MRMTPRARCCRAGAGSSATALHAKSRSIDCMILGPERCDWIRSDAQACCLVCALPREHTKMPESREPSQGRGEAERAKRTPRLSHGPVGPRYDCDRATGQRNHKKTLGQPTAPNNRRPPPAMPAHAPRAPGGALRPPEFTPTLSLERRISQRHIVVARAVGSAHAPPPSETDARASPQRRRPHRARAGQRPRRK